MAGPAQVLIEAFESRFHSTPDVFRAPGRVNLIGEHTDYNLGFVLPMAIDLACYAASAPNRDGVLRVYSLNLEEGREWPIAQIGSLQASKHWTDYVIGVVRQLPRPKGLDLMVHSTVPLGSGLSSSASIEVASALAAGFAYTPESRLELAKLCRRAENDFIGLPSGIMDQYVCVFGHENSAVQIDCANLTHRDVRLPPEAAFVAVNSMVKHQLGQSAYHQRVDECNRAVAAIQKTDPAIQSLRDADLSHLEAIADPTVRKRAKHVITEDRRVVDFVAASLQGDLAGMGRLFVASHRSLQNDYEVSCEELDFLVDKALEIEGVYGARMTGGGFGGCTVNLMDPGAQDRFEAAIGSAYCRRFGINPAFYRLRAAEGASQIS